MKYSFREAGFIFHHPVVRVHMCVVYGSVRGCSPHRRAVMVCPPTRVGYMCKMPKPTRGCIVARCRFPCGPCCKGCNGASRASHHRCSACLSFLCAPSHPGCIAGWLQITSLSEALETHFDYDRYTRSRGHERHRDEHTDITSLIHSVEGKTPSQVGREGEGEPIRINQRFLPRLGPVM